MEGRVAYVVKNDVFDKRKAYQIKINKLANKTARFITVIYPCKKTEGQTIEAVFTDNGYSANGASIKVTINGIEYPFFGYFKLLVVNISEWNPVLLGHWISC